MNTKPFQTKETKIICTDTGMVIDCYSNSLAENIMACVRMAINPEYHSPADGWGDEVNQILKVIKGRKIKREKYSHMNFIYIVSKEVKN